MYSAGSLHVILVTKCISLLNIFSKRFRRRDTERLKTELITSDPMAELAHEEQVLLMLLLEQLEPVGARMAHRLLADVDIHLSEASVSRMLLRLDSVELTHAIGKKGRVLTPKGKALIRLRAQQLQNNRNFQRALELRSSDEILDWLRARRLLEGEAAYLAALRLDDGSIQALEDKVSEHELSIRRGTLVEDGSGMNFHRELAAAIGSPVFKALIDTLSSASLANVEETLDTIVVKQGTADDSISEHSEILDAIRQREPEKARHIMSTHFDRLEADVRIYASSNFIRNLLNNTR